MKKLIFLVLGFLFLVSGVYAVDYDNIGAYWTLDNTLADATGNGHTLTNNGATYTSSGKINGAYSFDGINDYMNTGYNPNTLYSISSWVYFPTYASTLTIMGIRDSSGTAGTREFQIQHSASNTAFIQFYTSANADAGTLTGTITENAWNLLTLTRNGNSVQLFINGALVDTDGTSGKIDASYSLVLGRTGDQAIQYWDGKIDETGVWTRVLNSTEVLELYNGGVGIQYPFTSTSTPTITTDVQEFYNSENISIQLNTTTNTNMSYYLDDDDLIISDGLVAYYQAETNATDRLGTYNGTENGGVSYSDSINSSYGKAFSFDGLDDYMSIGSTFAEISKDKNYSFSVMIKPTLSGVDAEQIIYQNSISSTDRNSIAIRTDGRIACGYYDGTWHSASANILQANTWFHVVCINDNGDTRLFVNGVEYDQGVYDGYAGGSGNYLGSASTTIRKYNGSIDEVRIYNRALNTTEITQLYENSPYSTICEDCNNSVLNLTSLSEKPYNIFLMSTDINGVEITEDNFTIDLTPPIINNNIESTYLSYFIEGFNSSCSDLNLDYCNISLNSQNVLLNTSSFTFTNNGNISYTITSEDLAGNTNTENGTIFVNPYFYINAYDTNNMSYITDYTINGDSDTAGVVSYKIYDFGLGVQEFTFEKLGYATKYLNLTLTDSSNINYTINATPAKIVINIYDRDTENLITSLTTITLVATTGYNTTTTTGQVNISDYNFISELYTIIFENGNYQTESVYFTFTNQEELNINAYLIAANQTNLGYVTAKTITDIGQLIQGAICQALEWKPASSSYVAVAQGQTNVNGEVNLNIELGTKYYKLYCSKDGASVYSTSQIFTTTGQVVPMILERVVSPIENNFAGVTYSLINTSLNSTHQRIKFTFADEANLVQEGCLSVYEVHGTKRTTLQSSCVATGVGEIQLIQNINNTYNIIVVASVEFTDETREVDSISFKGTGALTESLRDYGLDIILPLIFILIGVSFGFLVVPHNVFLSAAGSIIMVWLSVLFVPTLISSSIAIFVTFISVVILWGGNKPK